MLCATISILGPGLGRLLPMASFGKAAPLVMFGVILAVRPGRPDRRPDRPQARPSGLCLGCERDPAQQ
jgi:hypothetical protein